MRPPDAPKRIVLTPSRLLFLLPVLESEGQLPARLTPLLRALRLRPSDAYLSRLTGAGLAA